MPYHRPASRRRTIAPNAYLDISVPLRRGLTVYTGDPPVSFERYASIGMAGSPCNLTRMDMGVHSGTHIDAPIHFIEGGAGVEETSPQALLGRALVVDATAVDGDIDLEALASLSIPAGTERVLFKTRNSGLWRGERFDPGYCGLTGNAAGALVERGVVLAGIDYLSIAPAADPAPAHIALLEAGTVVLEGLDLGRIEPGIYELVCLPLLIPGCDGAPARALLRRV